MHRQQTGGQECDEQQTTERGPSGWSRRPAAHGHEITHAAGLSQTRCPQKGRTGLRHPPVGGAEAMQAQAVTGRRRWTYDTPMAINGPGRPSVLSM
jgi:hypothetical protein